MTYTISREIGIDAGHRVPTHGSKCKNLHGHRYTIQAICESDSLHDEGEQKDMTLDFGFLKEEMVDVIDVNCDHGLILWIQDPILRQLVPALDIRESIADAVARQEYCLVRSQHVVEAQKIYVIAGIPTAEVLAKHWFERLAPRVSERSSRLATLIAVKVWETPNCWASYEKQLEPSKLRSLLEENDAKNIGR